MRRLHPRQMALLVKCASQDSIGFAAERVGHRRARAARQGCFDPLGAAMSWLCRSQDVTRGNGSSRGYSLVTGWAPPFPETTGYIIGTFLRQYAACGDEAFLRRACELGDWEIAIQNADGGVLTGLSTDLPKPSNVFNTGMVIHGWMDLFEATSDERYGSAARRAALFLRDNLGNDGTWAESVEYNAIPHTYNSRVAWAMVRVSASMSDHSVGDAATRQLDWTLSQQRSDGWFDSCEFAPGRASNTHGLAYTLRGLLESGVATGDPAYIESACRTARRLAAVYADRGWLPATFASGWKPTAAYECLTGSVQLGGVWLRLYQETGEREFLSAGLKAITETARRQSRSRNPDVHGAIAGSFPIYGRYAPLAYPNWATKFLADSLFLSRDVQQGI